MVNPSLQIRKSRHERKSRKSRHERKSRKSRASLPKVLKGVKSRAGI